METKKHHHSDTRVPPTRSVWSEIVDEALKEARKKVSEAERSDEPEKKKRPVKAVYSY